MAGHFETFARKICEFCMKNYVIPYLKEHGVVQSYRAQVISRDSGSKTIVVQRPFDNSVTLPYSEAGTAGLAPGSQCVVLVFGDSSNAVVVGDGKFNLY